MGTIICRYIEFSITFGIVHPIVLYLTNDPYVRNLSKKDLFLFGCGAALLWPIMTVRAFYIWIREVLRKDK